MSQENPLTARVAANRLWQQFFGTGLVRTSSDFGLQGLPPSHPELLEWLSAEYRSSGWDTKRLVKLMVMSHAFRRDARQEPDERAKDPQNLLLSRGPRIRLDAEQLRDNALFVSGLMNFQMRVAAASMCISRRTSGNRIGYGDSNTRYYLQDHGEALYRRSLGVGVHQLHGPGTVPLRTSTARTGSSCVLFAIAPTRHCSCCNLKERHTALRGSPRWPNVPSRTQTRAPPNGSVPVPHGAVAATGHSRSNKRSRRALAGQRELFEADPESAQRR
ncbi:MAG: DUF1553 domain-containing protein [Gemmataceae bacterium]